MIDTLNKELLELNKPKQLGRYQGTEKEGIIIAALCEANFAILDDGAYSRQYYQ